MALVCLAGCAVDGLGGIEQSVDEPISAVVYKFGGDEGGAPVVQPNVRVDFFAPDDSVQTVYTDDNGVAAAVSPEGTRVFVYQTAEAHRALVRGFYAAKPGDRLVVGYRPDEAFPLLGSVRFSLPRRDPDAFYQLTVSCSPNWGYSGPVQDLSIYDCPQATNATAVAYAFDRNTGELLSGPSVKRGLDLTQLVGTTVHMPGYIGQPSTITGTFVGVPTDALVYWGTSYYFDGDPKAFANASGLFINPTTVPLEIEGVGNRTFTMAQYELPDRSLVGQLLIENERRSSYVLDASNLVKTIGNATFDYASQTFHWSLGAGRPATIMKLHVVVAPYPRPDWQFELYAPANTTSLALPVLPPEITPVPGDRIQGSIYDYESGETYSALLEQASSRGSFSPYEWPNQNTTIGYAWGNVQTP